MEYDDIVKTLDGSHVITYDTIEKMRKKKSDKNIIAQKGCQEKFLSQSIDIVIFGGNRGGSKCQPYSELVCTPFGFREIGSLKVGDIITRIDGCMQKVIGITEVGNREIFRITFSDGTHADCTEEHLWKLRRTNHISKRRHLNGTEVDDDYELWTTRMISNFLKRQENGEISNGAYKNNLVIPLCGEVKFTAPIGRSYKPTTDPYILGAILGDGCVSDSVLPNAKFTTMDKEIVSQFEGCGYDMSHFADKEGSRAKDYVIRNAALANDIYGLKLNGCKSEDKFIPKQYKYGTVEERFALSQGLMDTDGSIDSRGHCSYTTVSPKLAEDFAFVLRSLGAYVTVTKNPAGYKGENGEYIACKDAYCLYIKIENASRLFRLTRKKELCRKFNGGKSPVTKRIVSCEFVGYDKARCITVSHPSALYLTNDFTVTHNSFSLLMETLKDIKNKDFEAIILRNEKDDLRGLVKTSYQLYDQFGIYNRAINDMTWNFSSGGSLKFSHYAGAYEDFETRFRGRQYSYIGIDEITQISYKKFKFLVSCNRNAAGIKNRFYGTCNPDPDSWVRKVIDWYIYADGPYKGQPIPERDGVIRYMFMDGDTPDSIYWGNTPEEVYEQAKHIIDPLWNEEYAKLGFNKITMFVKSFTFIKGKLEENLALIESDPNYVANLAQQGEEQRARDLDGNWDYKLTGEDLLKIDDMERFYANASNPNGARFVSADIAFEGGDFCVMWLWEGLYIHDIYVTTGDSATIESQFKAKLLEWGVREENCVYDFWGVGQALGGHLKRAVKFTGTQKCKPPFDKSYKNVKSQCAETLVHYIQDGKISINPRLLNLRFTGKNGKYRDALLSDILMKERKCIRHRTNSSIGGFELISKDEMKKVVGYSPDFFESLMYRMWYECCDERSHPAQGILQYASETGRRREREKICKIRYF